MELMDLTPDTHWLEAQRNQNLGWQRALGELIDNAIDASAANITIVAEKKTLTVTDDGIGCSDMEAMFRAGAHRPHATKGLGRFGIGLKDAAIWLWGTTIVDSVRNSHRYTASVNWEKLCGSKIWQTLGPAKTEAREVPSGTSILFSRIEQQFPGGKHFDRLHSELSYCFSPALKRGIRIVIRRGGSAPLELQRFTPPEFEKFIDGDIDVDGRRARVYAGVVKEGASNPRPGIHYTYRHRVIIPGSGLGCGDTSISRIFGWVSLSDQWDLTKNKDDISKHKDALASAVFAFIKPILDIAEKQAATVDLKGLEDALTKLVRQATAPKTEKEKREKGEKQGTIKPLETGRRRGAIKRQPGNKLPGAIDAGRLRVEFDATMDPDDGIGSVDVHGSRIMLAERHPYVAQLRLEINKASLFQLALSLLVHQCVIEPHNGQRLLPSLLAAEEGKQFSFMLSRFMLQITDMEKRNPRLQLVA